MSRFGTSITLPLTSEQAEAVYLALLHHIDQAGELVEIEQDPVLSVIAMLESRAEAQRPNSEVAASLETLQPIIASAFAPFLRR